MKLGTIALLVAIASVGQAKGQMLYGSITGTVTDASGAVVPAAQVRINNEGTGQSRQMLTDTGGTYSFPAVAPGIYDVSVTLSGFQSHTVKAIKVAVDQVARVDIALRVGSMTQKVEVTGAAPTLQTDSAQVGGELTTTLIENIPLGFDSNFQGLMITVPGISIPTQGGSFMTNPSAGMAINANGGATNENLFRIDGTDTGNPWSPTQAGYIPSRYAIETVSIITNSIELSQGIVGASAVNVNIKSGTNKMHGGLFERHMDNALSATPFAFTTRSPGYRNPKMIQNNFGGQFGGPIIKNKLFFFGSYDTYIFRNYGEFLGTVPTVAMKQGDFSAVSNPGATYTTLYDPSTGNADGTGRSAFENNQIPADRISSISQKVLDYLVPDPNRSGATSNYFTTGVYKLTHQTIDAKVDWNATDKLMMNGRLGLIYFSAENAAAFGDTGPGVYSNQPPGRSHGPEWSVTGSGSYSVSSNLIIKGNVGWWGMSSGKYPFDLDTNHGLETLGIPGTNGPNRLYGGWPGFSTTNYSFFGNQAGYGGPMIYDDRAYNAAASVSWVKGSHTIGFGGSFMRLGLRHFEGGYGVAGVFAFNVGTTALNTGSGSSATGQMNDMASLLLGLPYTESKDLLPFNDGHAVSHWHQYAFYVQDQWQVRPKVTVYAGLSWQHFPIGGRDNGQGFQRYDITTNNNLICGLGQNPYDCGYKVPWKDFSPSLGIAYRPTSTLVLRIGGGMAYDPGPLTQRSMLNGYPELLMFSLSGLNSYTNVTTLEQGIPAMVAPDISSGTVPQVNGYSGYSFAQPMPRDYVESWNFTIQKELKWGWSAQAGYVGNRHVNLPVQYNFNYGQIGGGAASQPLYQKYGISSAQYLLGMPYGHSNYDSLQAMLKHPFAKNFQLNVAYTLSKLIGNCCDTVGGGTPPITIPEYWGLTRGRMPWDARHTLSIAGVATSPFGRGQKWLASGAGSKLLGGWQVSYLLAARSGLPFTVTSSATSLNAPGNSQTADLVGSGPVQILGNTGPGQKWFDTSRFASVTAVRFGTSGYDILDGPRLVNLDFGLSRDFRLNERFALEFQGNAINLTNTPHFGQPSSNIDSSAAGNITSVIKVGGHQGIDQRTFQIAARLKF